MNRFFTLKWPPYLLLGLATLVALVTVALYWPALSHDYVNYDDDLYVTENVHVQNGLTLENVKWAFSNPVAAIWHPLTMLSHMLDCQLFSLKPWGHHLTSVLLHAANTVLVFALLSQLTGAQWRSVMVAAIFGLHPLHVESVAWVSERKDVLSTFFGLLSLLFYVCYVKKSTVHGPQSKVFYWLTLLFFALGLMSKPMLVTWPFVMLLLDWWPLGRFNPGSARRLVVEKIPFFAIAATASIVTCMVQQQTGALAEVEYLPLSARGANALISYCRYLGKLFWPTDLAVFYPRPAHWPLPQVLLACGFTVSITMPCIFARKRYPFLPVGWLWFCGTLVPVIGLIRVGEQAMADRYTYIPSLGVLIMVIWGAYELTRQWRHQVMILSVAGGAAIILCLGLTRQQLGYWRNSETLFRHALAVTKNNYLAHNNLGIALAKNGRIDEAIQHFQEAIRLEPDFVYGHINLGKALDMKGQTDEEIGQFQEVIRLKPNFAKAHNTLGFALGEKGRINEAMDQFQEAIRLKPDFAEAHNNLGTVLGMQGRIDEAISQFQEAIRLRPDYAEAHNNLGNALRMKGQTDQAILQYQEAIRLKPDYAKARNSLAQVLEKSNAPTNR